MMKKSVPIPNEEVKRDHLRPAKSTRKKTKSAVATSFTMPYTPEASRDEEALLYPIDWKTGK